MCHRLAISFRVGLLLFHVLAGHDQPKQFPHTEMLQHLGGVLLASGGHTGQVMPGGLHRAQYLHQRRIRSHHVQKVTVQRLFAVVYPLYIGGAGCTAHQRRQKPRVVPAVAALGVVFIGHGKAQLFQRRAVGRRVGGYGVQQRAVQVHTDQHSFPSPCTKSATSLATITSPA